MVRIFPLGEVGKLPIQEQEFRLGIHPQLLVKSKERKGSVPQNAFLGVFLPRKQCFGYEAFFSDADTASSTYRSLVLIHVKRQVAFLVPKTHALYSHLESLRIVGRFYCLHKEGEK